ncbi:hypothetical protein N9E04_00480 [bacterium]|nr:hypothetical protein [bacterium]
MLVTEGQIPDEELARLLDEVPNHEPVSQGGNSSIYRTRWNDRDIAIKDYRARSDLKIRASREWNGLSLLWSSGLRIAPEPLGVNLVRGLLAMEWIETSDDRDPISPDEAISLLKQLRRAENDPLSHSLDDAADSILEPRDLLRQVNERLVGLRKHESLGGVLKSVEQALEMLSDPGNGSHTAIRILSPSDFGSHNSIRGARGVRLIDLEFFGWDDAHKLVADTILHPMNPWTNEARWKFIESAQSLYSLDTERLMSVTRLGALKWAVIIIARAFRQQSEGDLEGCSTSLGLADAYARRALEFEPWR